MDKNKQLRSLAETYQALIEAELLRGKEAHKKMAQLAAEGNPNAIKALQRVERFGQMSPSQRPATRKRNRSFHAEKDPFDTENLGFADAQLRSDPRGRKASDDDMNADAITRAALESGFGPRGSGLSPYQYALLKMAKRTNPLGNITRTEE